ncbi:aspartic proteinase-like protein 2, partial [Asparagus officinalis]|uniref:aspartic proteinase-like protein 2 n=1 Tax=Asparagus officinalis TaxID=4686 RepID=UPI00098E0E93
EALGGVVDFPVQGSSSPFVAGLYFTRVKLGNPAKEFYVQIDTGSDVLWVNCNGCTGCPTSSELDIQLKLFDPKSSSTASLLSCSDQMCTNAIQTGEGTCSFLSSSSSQCSYSFQYGDGSATSGYYVSDTLHFDTVAKNDQQVANSSAKVIFGCSNSQSGRLTNSSMAVDGIFGLGKQQISVISQLSSAGVSSGVFSHCLKGSDKGGGILVLGQIDEPGIVYTPLVQYQPHFNVNLESIHVNGQQLNIDSSVFSTSTTSTTQGTIVDSGTTLAYIAEKAYDPFINAVVSSIQSSKVQPVNNTDYQCFATTSSVDHVFPPITFNFAGNAALNLKPRDYLLQQGEGNATIWCIGWQKIEGGTTILGDLVLKDKIIVYDLANQRIGWKNYDCSLPVNVSSSSGNNNEYVNTKQSDVSISSRNTNYALLPLSLAVLLVHELFGGLGGGVVCVSVIMQGPKWYIITHAPWAITKMLTKAPEKR